MIFEEDERRLNKNGIMLLKAAIKCFPKSILFFVFKEEYLVTQNSSDTLSHFIPSTHLWRRIEDILFSH